MSDRKFEIEYQHEFFDVTKMISGGIHIMLQERGGASVAVTLTPKQKKEFINWLTTDYNPLEHDRR